MDGLGGRVFPTKTGSTRFSYHCGGALDRWVGVFVDLERGCMDLRSWLAVTYCFISKGRNVFLTCSHEIFLFLFWGRLDCGLGYHFSSVSSITMNNE